MLDSELAEIVANLRTLGSDVTDVEVKAAAGGLPKSLRETLSAFANTQGGVIVLGLDERADFTAAGLADAAKLAADLASMCSDDLEPPIRPHIRIHQFEGEQVLVAEIPECDPGQKPCFSRGTGLSKGSFVRVGDGDRHLSAYEIQIMLASRGQPREDERPVPGVTLDDLDKTSLEAVIARLRTSRPYAFSDLDSLDVLRRAKILVSDGSRDAVSMAGLLALGSYPQGRFPQLMVTFVHYPTTTGVPVSGERFLDNVTLEGPIPVMVRDTMAAIRRNMSRRAVVGGTGRTDIWEYPETALREAIVNALVHRDLSSGALGTQVQIEMYPDRLLMRNPGGLFGPVTVETLGDEGISSARNATLIRLLEDVPLPGDTRTVCENRGSGIRAMIASLRATGMSPPEFTDKISSFVVVFPNHTLLSNETFNWLSGLGATGLTDTQCIALAMLKEEGEFDNRTYRNATGVDSRIATAELQDLVARELITQTGTRRWARYELATQHTKQPSRGDRRAAILDAMGDDSLSRTEVAARTGLSDKTVRHWIKILRDEGAIDIVGNPKSPHVKYRKSGQNPLFTTPDA